MSHVIGQWEANWDKQQQLGSGGQGLTYLVSRKSSADDLGVLKLLRNNKSQQARLRMVQEVGNLGILSAAGCKVPAVLEHNTSADADPGAKLYVIMEYVPGGTLQQVIGNSGPLGLEQSAELVLALCETIRAAHELRIYHRDLKPSNIIVRDLASADVVVIDYGLSFNAEEGAEITQSDETFRNRFLALPETNTPGGDRRDPRSDITAACGILYFCLTGSVPGQLQSANGQLPHRRSGHSIRERLAGDLRTKQLEVLLDRGFTPNIESRFQTVEELADRLRAAVAATDPEVTEDPIDVAKRASERLSARDRVTQLQGLRPKAEALVTSITGYVRKVYKELGNFSLSTKGGRSDASDLPDGIDAVPHAGTRVTLSAAHHQDLRIVEYRVGSRSDQCVLLRACFARSAGGKQPQRTSDWEEVLWYDAATPPDQQSAVDDFRRWLTSAIEGLARDIAG